MVVEPWIGSMWISSRYNFDPEVRAGLSLPGRVQLYDVTLRDGEQMPGVVFRREDKVRIAQVLDEIGVHRLEAGMPAVSDEDFEAAREIAHLGLEAKTVAFCRARKSDVDLALKCDVWGALIEVPSSDTLIHHGFQWSRERIMAAALEATGYAKEHGLHVTFFPYDTTRADPEYLRTLVTRVVNESKVDAIACVDTFGCASPQAIAQLVKKVRGWVNVPIEIHCHNDMGLATANALAAVTAGAEVVHTNLCGIGERAGGAATEEVAVALKILYGVDLNLRYEHFYKAGQIIQEATGFKLWPGKPVVGENAFGYEAGIPVMFLKNMKPINALKEAYSYLPEFVGNKIVVAYGKKSGGNSVEWRLDELGLKATEEQTQRILKRIKEKSITLKRALKENEVDQIIREEMER
jgi:methanogen homocitrate synthase